MQATAANSGDVGDGGVEQAEYIGCFHDNRGDPVLGNKRTSSDMTTKVCLDYCTGLGSAYAATQYGYECWCSADHGLDFNRHYDMIGEDAVCDMLCLGDETLFCGGYDAFDLYELACSGRGYEQCGGLDYTGSTCCPDGFSCEEHGDQWHFQVQVEPQPVASPQLQSSAACSDRAYEQCAGIGYTGVTCCPDGHTCDKSDESYSQCRPDDTVTAPTPHPRLSQWNRRLSQSNRRLSQWNPHLSQWNPRLSRLNRLLSQWNPHLSQWNRRLSQWNPHLSQWNPRLSQWNPRLRQWNRRLRQWNPRLSQWDPRLSRWSPAPQPVASPDPQQPVGDGQYGQTYTGEGTYYGFTTDGNCAYRSLVPSMYQDMIPIALNNVQYGDSLMCGACLEGRSNGIGSGANRIPSTFKGWISDRCPECSVGDLDFSMSGDGRWEIEWEFVPCPGESISFVFEGSNPYYWKIQPRGTKTPVVSLTINGQPALRSEDNFFILEGGPWDGAQTVQTTTVAGYDDSQMCGACLEGTADGTGSGYNPIPSTYKGFITDRCPECSTGDLDFSVSGDGRWDIEWEFVPCPGESISFVFEGSNPYYWKIQPRGTKTPVVSLTINGKAAWRTQDNFFELGGGPWNGPQTVVTETMFGVTQTSQYGFTTAGNCAYRNLVPSMYQDIIPIALNNAQYGDSLMCGACLEGRSNGIGSGANRIPSTFKGWISDRCPECSVGDLDFSMSGDGRWEIEWEFVPCPGQENISFVFEGSNPYYWMIQPRGTKTPVVSLTINGQPALRSQDNFFILEGGPWDGAQTVQTTTVAGYGHTTSGNCAYGSSVPDMYDGMYAIALNNHQYDDSQMCGACLEGTADGTGSGYDPIPSTYKGFITDRCPECSTGDLDFSVSGDGRWDIEWEFVPCPGESISFVFEGSNPYYWKIQPRGTKTPVVSLTINGKAAWRTQDNFFELGGGPWNGPQTVVTETMFGVTQTSQVSL
eukprot:g12093.t1